MRNSFIQKGKKNYLQFRLRGRLQNRHFWREKQEACESHSGSPFSLLLGDEVFSIASTVCAGILSRLKVGPSVPTTRYARSKAPAAKTDWKKICFRMIS